MAASTPSWWQIVGCDHAGTRVYRVAVITRLEDLEAELRTRRLEDLLALQAQCGAANHLWEELREACDSSVMGHYCRRCLRVRVGEYTEFWPTLPPG